MPLDPTFWLPRLSTAWLLLLARTAGLAGTAPGWGMAGVGWRVRMGLAVLLTAVLGPTVVPRLEQERGLPASIALTVPAIGPSGLTWPQGLIIAKPGVEDWATFGLAMAVEAAVGVALGLAAALVVSAARQAGEVIGLQAGLAPASLLAPEEADMAGGSLTPLGHLYGLVALAVFLAVDGPLRLVEVLAESYDTVPVGLGLGHGFVVQPPTPELARAAFGYVGVALALTVRAAAPAALAMVLAGLALGWLARAAPNLAPTLSGLVWPARSVLGLIFAWIGLIGLATVMAAAW